jgi:hypothetical protein
MIVKIMSGEDAADEDVRKLYMLVSGVKEVKFVRRLSPNPCAIASIVRDDGVIYDEEVHGNVYVMNDAGKTVSSFGVAQIPG